MSKKNDRTVYRQDDGNWANKKNTATKAGSRHSTQEEAIKAAKKMLEKDGGGELTVKGVNGKIRSKDTIGTGNDPRKIKDKEH